ncbi:hypothetical protein AB0E81_11295 [Streptomyces sp. NPDC033538]
MSRHAKDSHTDAQRLADEFDAQLRESERRADEKRAVGQYPYDLEGRP